MVNFKLSVICKFFSFTAFVNKLFLFKFCFYFLSSLSSFSLSFFHFPGCQTLS